MYLIMQLMFIAHIIGSLCLLYNYLLRIVTCFALPLTLRTGARGVNLAKKVTNFDMVSNNLHI